MVKTIGKALLFLCAAAFSIKAEEALNQPIKAQSEIGDLFHSSGRKHFAKTAGLLDFFGLQKKNEGTLLSPQELKPEEVLAKIKIFERQANPKNSFLRKPFPGWVGMKREEMDRIDLDTVAKIAIGTALIRDGLCLNQRGLYSLLDGTENPDEAYMAVDPGSKKSLGLKFTYTVLRNTGVSQLQQYRVSQYYDALGRLLEINTIEIQSSSYIEPPSEPVLFDPRLFFTSG